MTRVVPALLLLAVSAPPAFGQFPPRYLPPPVNSGEAILAQIVQSDPDPGRRREAARQLASVGTTDSLAALTQAAAYDPDRETRVLSGDAVAAIRSRGTILPPAPPTPTTPGNGYGDGDRWPTVVGRWYQHFLGRAVDPEGLNNLVNQLRAGQPPEEALAVVLGSDEYYQRHGGYPQGFIAGLYTDLLSRSPNAEEMSNWMRNLPRHGARQEGRRRFAEQFIRDARGELNRRRPGRWFGW